MMSTTSAPLSVRHEVRLLDDARTAELGLLPWIGLCG